MEMTCSLCKSLRPNGPKTFQNETEAQEHARIHLYQMKILDGTLAVDHIYHQCFKKSPKVERDSARSVKGRNQALHDACRSIFGRRQKKPIAACNICGLGIHITCGKKLLKTTSIIRHARFHSKVKIFKCQYCSCSFSKKEPVVKHLIRSHQIEVPRKGDFVDRTDLCQKEILIAIKRCFDQCPMQVDQAAEVSKEFLAETAIRTKKNGTELGVERNLLCFRLIKKGIGSDGKIKCYLCSKRISAKNTNCLITRCATDHAQFHLQKPVYECKKCKATFVSHTSMAKHLNKKHSLGTAGNYDYLADNFHAELSATISQCYEEETVLKGTGRTISTHIGSVSTNPQIPILLLGRDRKAILSKDDWSRLKGGQVIKTLTYGSTLAIQRRTYCNDLLRRCASIDGMLKCYLCSTEIRAKDGHSFLGTRAIDHAAFHMQKPLYRCKICTSACNSHSSMKGHLKTKHALGMQNNNECYEDDYHQEILTTLSECYETRTEETQTSEESTKGIRHKMKGEQTIRGCTKGSKFAVERHTLCNTVVRKNVKPDGKMKCRLCMESINGVDRGRFVSNPALSHVRLHLGKAFYRCVVCSTTYTAYDAIAHHLTKEHGLKMTGNYESLEDEYHDEVMAKLSECFDVEMSTAE